MLAELSNTTIRRRASGSAHDSNGSAAAVTNSASSASCSNSDTRCRNRCQIERGFFSSMIWFQNINVETGEIQGDYGMIAVGPYDRWAIEYGYSFKEDLKPVLSRVGEPELAYATDEDAWGPDPYARRYDMGKDPLTYAENQMRLAQHHRQRGGRPARRIGI